MLTDPQPLYLKIKKKVSETCFLVSMNLLETHLFILRSLKTKMKSLNVKAQYFPYKPTHRKIIKIWHSDRAQTKKQADFIVYSALGPDKLHQMPGSPRGHCLPDRYSSYKGSVTATMSCLAIYIFLAVGFFKNYINVAPSKGSITSYGEMPDKFSAHFP